MGAADTQCALTYLTEDTEDLEEPNCNIDVLAHLVKMTPGSEGLRNWARDRQPRSRETPDGASS